MLKDLFKKTKYIKVNKESGKQSQKKQEKVAKDSINIPDGTFVKCPDCGEVIYKRDFRAEKLVCKNCNRHARLGSRRRIKQILDDQSFVPYDENLLTENVLNFPGYDDKIEGLMDKTGLNSAVLTGEGTINGEKTVIGVMDSRFLMGSMGQVVGEKLTRAIEKATEKKLPIIIFTASGGARMQEGIFSLMQMAKTSAALAKHNEAGQLYISVLTDPTTGGVTASFAMLGDIILAEPGALIGFAGRRVIEQTIKQQLPDDFQKAEFLLEHGFIDKIVHRHDMKKTLHQILCLHKGAKKC